MKFETILRVLQQWQHLLKPNSEVFEAVFCNSNDNTYNEIWNNSEGVTTMTTPIKL